MVAAQTQRFFHKRISAPKGVTNDNVTLWSKKIRKLRNSHLRFKNPPTFQKKVKKLLVIKKIEEWVIQSILRIGLFASTATFHLFHRDCGWSRRSWNRRSGGAQALAESCTCYGGRLNLNFIFVQWQSLRLHFEFNFHRIVVFGPNFGGRRAAALTLCTLWSLRGLKT